MPLLRTLLGLPLAWALLAAPAHALDATALEAKLTRESNLLGRAAGAHVLDLDTGAVLFSRRPDTKLVPASNEKLFTTATALLTQGPEARRQTRVVATAADGVPVTGEVPGVEDLYVVGSGDPSFSNADIAAIANQLVGVAGLEEVEGGVVGDEGLLDTKRGSVDSGFRPDFNLGGQLGALVVGHGVARPGGPAQVVAERLQAQLKALGVTFGRKARTGRVPADASEPIAIDESPPMSELVRTTNQASDNFYAELLLKVVGAQVDGVGSTAGGATVVRRTLAPLGVRPTISDGSGLSRRNRASARQLVTLLTAMRADASAPAWLGSMTVVGRNGTLRKRMRGTAAAGRCSGKTGTLRGVSALSGYCTTTAGRNVVFSFVANGVGPGAKRVEDRMVAALARYGG